MQPVLKQKTSSSLSKKDNVRLNKGPTLNLRGCQFSLFFFVFRGVGWGTFFHFRWKLPQVNAAALGRQGGRARHGGRRPFPTNRSLVGRSFWSKFFACI